jgi:hypothetical protein
MANPQFPGDPMADYRRLTAAAKPVDPMADYRRLMAAAKPVDPMAEYRRMMAATEFNPLGEYRRILEQFSRVAGAEPSLANEPPFNQDGAERSGLASLPNVVLLNTLFGIAWTCIWMIVHGASIEDVGAVLSGALGLALYLQQKR